MLKIICGGAEIFAGLLALFIGTFLIVTTSNLFLHTLGFFWLGLSFVAGFCAVYIIRD